MLRQLLVTMLMVQGRMFVVGEEDVELKMLSLSSSKLGIGGSCASRRKTGLYALDSTYRR